MNFMSGRSGFYEDAATGSRGMSSSSSPSSSSSSLHHLGFPPFTYPQQHTTNGGEETTEESDNTLQLLRRGGGEGSSSAAAIQREHMFDKVVTPSDVGKLNRLVIPKQHAEKYFPLDSSTNEKGLLLNFEDRNGKPWRFRYSYWNSSQSYVMTKGWSRFVKEKKLDAGDIVSFQRGVGEVGRDRLFIDWRRRPDAPDLPPPIPTLSFPHHISFHRSVHPWSPYLMPQPSRDYQHFLQPNHTVPHHHFPSGNSYAYSSIVNGNPCPPGSILYVRSGAGVSSGGYGPQQIGPSQGAAQRVYESVPVVQGKAAAKRLRLFGVNMDCPISESDDCEILSSTTLAHPTLPLHLLPSPPSLDSSTPITSLHLSSNYNQDDDEDDDDDDKGYCLVVAGSEGTPTGTQPQLLRSF